MLKLVNFNFTPFPPPTFFPKINKINKNFFKKIKFFKKPRASIDFDPRRGSKDPLTMITFDQNLIKIDRRKAIE